MNTHVFQLYQAHEKPVLLRRENAFLEALHDIDYGRLSIITPEHRQMEFYGRYNGPAAVISISDWDVFDELVARGEIGFAEAYMDGRWNSPDVTALMTFALVNTVSLERFFHGKPLHALWHRIKSALRDNSLQGSRRNIQDHYDLGNDFYALWLDKSMTYSCGLFGGENTLSLEQAQQAKYERILDKLEARPGDHVLDMGCGWGGFALVAAARGIQVTGITISQQQADYARQKIAQAGLTGMVSIQLCDYREIEGLYDHVVSIGMFEHVGEKYWADYFRIIYNHLKPTGSAMVQSITLDAHLFETLHGTSGFMDTYIFPGAMLPSKYRLQHAAKKEGLITGDLFAFGEDYAITLGHWLKAFDVQRPAIVKMGYDERFIRMWRFYLSSCIAGFVSRRVDVVQLQLKHGL